MNWILFIKNRKLLDFKQLSIALGSGALMGLSPAPLISGRRWEFSFL